MIYAQEDDRCPVCGYDEMPERMGPGVICPCCGTQFESEGFDGSYPELRSEWIDRYMPWFSRGKVPPKNWSPYRQLIAADFGSDLISHPRMKTDEDYRYAVDEAFSDIRIAKQLKVLRESYDTPLTQKALAERAEMKQSRISELEGMNYSSWSVSTLKRLARALGVRFNYSFESWSHLVPEIENGLKREALAIPSFERDSEFQAALNKSLFGDYFSTNLAVLIGRSSVVRKAGIISPWRQLGPGTDFETVQKREDQINELAGLSYSATLTR